MRCNFGRANGSKGAPRRQTRLVTWKNTVIYRHVFHHLIRSKFPFSLVPKITTSYNPWCNGLGEVQELQIHSWFSVTGVYDEREASGNSSWNFPQGASILGGASEHKPCTWFPFPENTTPARVMYLCSSTAWKDDCKGRCTAQDQPVLCTHRCRLFFYSEGSHQGPSDFPGSLAMLAKTGDHSKKKKEKKEKESAVSEGWVNLGAVVILITQPSEELWSKGPCTKAGNGVWTVDELRLGSALICVLLPCTSPPVSRGLDSTSKWIVHLGLMVLSPSAARMEKWT